MAASDTLRLSQLAAKVEKVVYDAFSALQFWVIADVTNHNKKAGTNYHYFVLVEKAPGSNELLAKFSAKAWGDGAREISVFEARTGQKFTNNIQVLVRVAIQYHAIRGIQLNLTSIDTNFTLGVLEQQRIATLERLCRENAQFIQRRGEEYWTRNKGIKLQLVIQKIAVVCARGSAGWQDFQHTIENNSRGYKFDVTPFFTNVQGDANAPAMRERMIEIYQSRVKFDLVVIIRGGGAQTDFLIFDHYLVGQAIARFPIPVITGIGHQKNTTIADLMAHTSVKTPTQVAEFVINHNRFFEEQLLTIQKNLLIQVQQFISVKNRLLNNTRAQITNAAYRMMSDHKQDLFDIRQDIIANGRQIPFAHRNALNNLTATMFSKPKIILGAKFADLKNSVYNIKINQSTFLKASRSYLGHFESYFNAVSPASTLKRGFAIVKYNGKIISEPDLLKAGDKFSVIIKDTELQAQLQNKKDYHGE
jgi:exodeoxyribonuclease VII large subunit